MRHTASVFPIEKTLEWNKASTFAVLFKSKYFLPSFTQ